MIRPSLHRGVHLLAGNGRSRGPWIGQQVALGRNAQGVYQDLVESHGFAHRYNSVKRFVHALQAREPERFDVLEALPGEEAQVDYGRGR